MSYVSGKVGQFGVVVHFNTINQAADVTQHAIEGIVKRSASGPSGRMAFDNLGAAKGFAALQAGSAAGAVVIERDNPCFAARHSGSPDIMGADPPNVELHLPWYANAGAAVVGTPVAAPAGGVVAAEAVVNALRDHQKVYRVDQPAEGVKPAIGKNGFNFPLNEDPQPEREQASKTGPGVPIKPGAEPPKPQAPEPQKLDDLRAVAGILPEGAKPGEVPRPDEVRISPAQMDNFIIGYFRLLGTQALNDNEAEVDSLSKIFALTTGGSKQQEGDGVSADAQALINTARSLALRFRPMLEEKEKPRKEIAETKGLAYNRQDVSGPERGSDDITIGGQTKPIAAWQRDLEDRQAEIRARADHAVQRVATAGPTGARAGRAFRHTSGSGQEPLWPGDGLTQERREMRVGFEHKLDDVRAARDARGKMAGADVSFLLGLSGLRERVKADFQRSTATNVELRKRLDELIARHQEVSIQYKIAATVVTIGLMFVPGGQLLSALAGFALAAADMNEAMRRYTVASASVCPEGALADQQAAASELCLATIDLAVAAVTLGYEVRSSLAINRGCPGPPSPSVPRACRIGPAVRRSRRARPARKPAKRRCAAAASRRCLKNCTVHCTTRRSTGSMTRSSLRSRQPRGCDRHHEVQGRQAGGGGLRSHDRPTAGAAGGGDPRGPGGRQEPG